MYRYRLAQYGRNRKQPAGSSCGPTKAKRERRKNSKAEMDWNF